MLELPSSDEEGPSVACLPQAGLTDGGGAEQEMQKLQIGQLTDQMAVPQARDRL